MSDNNPPPLPPPLNPPPGISTSSSNGSSSAADPFLEGAAQHNSLDHALLESLFYNEMALLDNNSNNSNNGHGLLLVEPQQDQQQDQQPVNDDVDVQVEQDLLKDFGVTDRAAPMAAQPPPQQQQQSIQHLLPSGRGIRHNVVVPAVTGSSSVGGAAGSTGGSVGSTGANVGTIPSGTSNTVPTQRNHMVSQFATLAERLGIDLPPQVLSKLTNNTNNTIQSVDAIAPQPAPSTSSPTSASNHHHTNNDNTNNNTSTLTEQLQTAATASIAAATASTTNKRKDDNTSNNNNNNKLPYSKRRKKPRLDDCDRRLAELQAEHELLKKHLQTITSQSQKISQERKQAETKMRQMFHTNAPDSQLQPAVHHFTEMYSDYGKKRHQELSFHLEQLQRLATPTNFTKMGLWTLGGAGGQSKQRSHNNKKKKQYNPINSILQKELGISVSQGRKILDQREKIRTLCDNLKVTQSLLHKLQSLCQQKTQIFYERMKLCQEILTPRQVVKLLLWIDENSSTLEQVCPGWGSEVK